MIKNTAICLIYEIIVIKRNYLLFSEFQDLKQQPNWYIGLYDSFQSSNYLWSDGTLKVFNDFIQERPSRDFWPCVHLIEKGWTDAPCWIPVGVICKKKQGKCLEFKLAIAGVKFLKYMSVTLVVTSVGKDIYPNIYNKNSQGEVRRM